MFSSITHLLLSTSNRQAIDNRNMTCPTCHLPWSDCLDGGCGKWRLKAATSLLKELELESRQPGHTKQKALDLGRERMASATQCGRMICLVQSIASKWCLPVEVQSRIEVYCHAEFMWLTLVTLNLNDWRATWPPQPRRGSMNRLTIPRGPGTFPLKRRLINEKHYTYFGYLKCEPVNTPTGIKIIGVNPSNPTHMAKKFANWRKRNPVVE